MLQVALLIHLIINSLTSLFYPINCDDKELILRTNNVISYSSCGSGETIVFVHAGGLDKHMWQCQMDLFKEEYRVITYDIRGHGDSYFKDNSTHEIADLKALVDTEKINSMYLVGCSLGSIIALDYAIKYPEMVKKLALVSPGLIGLQETNEEFLKQMQQYIGALQQGDTLNIVKQLKMLNALGKVERVLPVEMEGYLNESLRSYVQRGGLTRPPMINTINPMESLPDIDLSALIVIGEWDHTYIQENAEYLSNHLGDASVKQIDDAGHLPNLEQPSAFNEVLSDFLRK